MYESNCDYLASLGTLNFATGFLSPTEEFEPESEPLSSAFLSSFSIGVFSTTSLIEEVNTKKR